MLSERFCFDVGKLYIQSHYWCIETIRLALEKGVDLSDSFDSIYERALSSYNIELIDLLKHSKYYNCDYHLPVDY
jgi:hypothetical protein